jgi:NDP-sugar pyrophosphorylase family protein
MRKKSVINHAIILAAGRGIRMMPYTIDKPKALVEFDGDTLISYGIREVKKNIQYVHITVGYKKAMLAKYVIERDVASVINTESKGNCWWVFNSLLKFLNEPVLVLTCDNVVNLDISLLLENYILFGEPPCMVVPVKPIPGLEGDYIFHSLNKVYKLSRDEISDSYCSGVQIINPYMINKYFKPVEDFNELWNQLIVKDQLYCSEIYPQKWFSFDSIDHLDKFKFGK